MKNLQHLFHIHTHFVIPPSHLLLTFCLLQKITAPLSTHDRKTFADKLDNIQFDHLLVDKHQRWVFIGAANRLYQLNSNLELMAKLNIPLQDYSCMECYQFECSSNSVTKSADGSNRILVIDYTHEHLISCWSICHGLCKVYSIKDLRKEATTVNEPVVSHNDNTSMVSFFAPGPGPLQEKLSSGNEKLPTLYVGITDTKTMSQLQATRTVDNYFRVARIGSTSMTLRISSITFFGAYRSKCIVNYVYGFSSGPYSYFLTNQVDFRQPSSGVSKLIRICHRDSSYNSYVEIPMECLGDKGKRYDLAQAAFVAKPSFELAKSLGITQSEDVFFGIFAQNEQQIEGDELRKSNHKSALCIYSLKEINEKFTQNIQQNYFDESGYCGPGFMTPPAQKCMKNETIVNSDSCGVDVNLPFEGESPVTGKACLTFDTILTAIVAQPHPDNFTAVFVGTSTGHVMQIVVQNVFNAYLIQDIVIQKGFVINSDLHFYPETDHLYVMTEHRLTKIKILFPVPSISAFKPFLALSGETINITILGENLWCASKDIQHSIVVAGIHCTACQNLNVPSTGIICTIYVAELKEYEGPVEIWVNGIYTKSKKNFKILNPLVSNIFPKEGSLYGGNKLIIQGERLKFANSINVFIGDIPCIVFDCTMQKISCITSPSFLIMEASITIKFDESVLVTGLSYKYSKDIDHDENGFNLVPKGIPAGGIIILMYTNTAGLNKALIPELFFQVSNNIQKYNSTNCEMQSSILIKCLSPQMPEIDSRLIDAENPEEFNYTLFVSLNRTNDDETPNLIDIKSSKFFLYPNPVFEHYSITELDKNIRFIIKGQNLDNACQIQDFRVRIGKENCEVKSSSRNELICELSKSAAQYSYSKYDTNNQEDNVLTVYESVWVQIGNKTETTVPYYKYTADLDDENPKWMVYALYGGAFVVIVIFLVFIKVLIVYKQKSIKSLITSREMQQQINKMGMEAITMRQCIKQIVVEKQIDIDGSLRNTLKLPNIAIEYTPLSEGDGETSPETEYLLPLDTKWEFSRSKLTFGRFLGEGEFGRVVQSEASGIMDGNISTTVAVKMLKEIHSDADMIDLVSEMVIMKLIGTHNNVLSLLGCCTQNGPLLIITEYAEHGNLRDYLQKHLLSANNTAICSNLTQKALITFGLQVAQGMEYLSSMKCVHRDLAARNILVSNDLVLKIADFGLARDIRDKDYYRKKTGGRLPVKWMAPEALHRSLYTTQSDVWSFGVLLWEIVTSGSLPYPTFIKMEELVQALDDGYRMKKPQNCSMKMYSIMRECWNYLPENRPTFSMILENLEEMSSADDNEILEEPVSCESKLSNIDTIEIVNEATETDYLLE
ncbi:hepatocyte growth factor receptor-like [Planococcus citri]|uniref:hepatocyte growth factor receptor-like n=1 Tax=Planococcus citri TaxID=170843 RepID=UPI0031F7F94F